MWEIVETDEYLRCLKHYKKKHPKELRAVLDNLNTYFEALLEGAAPNLRLFGFMHTEGQGVLALDQKGGGKSLAQTRLYLYAARKTQQLYLLMIGGKKGQSQDVQDCHEMTKALHRAELAGDSADEELGP